MGLVDFLGLCEKVLFLIEMPWGWSYPDKPSFLRLGYEKSSSPDSVK
jgi:hypothetical protein